MSALDTIDGFFYNYDAADTKNNKRNKMKTQMIAVEVALLDIFQSNKVEKCISDI